MREHFESGAILPARITGNNKGGLLVLVGNLQGFIPSSQIVCFPRHLGDAERESFLTAQLDAEIEVRVIELDRDRNRLVLSERACILPREDEDVLLDRLGAGGVCEGLISNLCSFGAFVDLGGLDGLIHISEISWQRINHPGDILDIGQRIRVQVLSVDKPGRRIALSLKRLRADPWATIEKRFQIGQVVPGVITNIVEFGAFARIDEGLEGLIHLSELSNDDVLDPRAVVSPGQELDLCIVRIDGANHRLGLSLKRALGHGPADGPEAMPGEPSCDQTQANQG
jgi:small subunit ribosomal protein S1